jgi:hypothetical protein
MKLKIYKLTDLTTFGETLIDFIPFFSVIYIKNNGLCITFGLYKWSYNLTMKKNKNEYFQ